MTTKQQYEAVLSAEDDVSDYLHVLELKVSDTDLILGDQITLIENALMVIKNASNEKLVELAEQSLVMNSFLGEMKVVFEKYSATISTMSFEDGYGNTYGEPGTGFLLTASLGSVTSTKEIKKSAIGSGELV